MVVNVRAGNRSENGFDNGGDAVISTEPDIDRFGRVFRLVEGAAGAEGGGPDDDFGDRISFTRDEVINSGDDAILVLGPKFLGGGKVGSGEMGGFEEVDGGFKQGGRYINRKSGDVQAAGLVPEAGNGEIRQNGQGNDVVRGWSGVGENDEAVELVKAGGYLVGVVQQAFGLKFRRILPDGLHKAMIPYSL